MDIYDLAGEWLRLDQDPITRLEIENLINDKNILELERRLRSRIAFGTAGLRAKAEAGFARMNCLTVIQTSQGLAQYLLDINPGLLPAEVVIGFDGRKDSLRFAEVAAAAFASYGFSVVWFDGVVHTPLIPFTVRTRKAAAGVMITASHNPKDDNGYKVYTSSGCQINTPVDQAITASILENLVPRSWNKLQLEDHRDTMMSAYFECLKTMVTAKTFPRFVYTPLHGVGLPFIFGALERILETEQTTVANILSVVPSQAHPDASFPTVVLPNPEECGALDLAKAQAESLGVNLIIANDPDADRLAVAQKVGTEWHQFKGDEMGALLGYYVFKARAESFKSHPTTMLTTAVSSEMLSVIGKTESFVVKETLTGFKWIGGEALRIGKSALFGYEEALGYMFPDVVHDKDGIAAALTLLQACTYWGKLPFAILKDLYTRYGYFDTANTYFKSPDVATTKRTFDAIRFDPMAVTKLLGGTTYCRVRDLVAGTDTGMGSGKATLPSGPENLMITLWFSGHPSLHEGVRCTIRASGTEPKIKECQSKHSLDEARRGAINILKFVRQAWFRDPSLQMEARFEVDSRP